MKEFIEKAKTLPHQAITEGEDAGQDNGHQGGDEGDDSHVLDDGDGDDRASIEGSGQQIGEDDDEGYQMSGEEDGRQLPEDEGMEEQMEDLELQDPIQNEDESGSGNKDNEGWTVVSSKRKVSHNR